MRKHLICHGSEVGEKVKIAAAFGQNHEELNKANT